MAMVITETDVASLRKQLVGTAPNQSEPPQQQHVETEDLSASGRGYCIYEDRLNHSLNPALSQSLGGPEDFYMFQLGLMSSIRYWSTGRLPFNDGIFTNIYNNYDKFRSSLLPVDSTLLHARTRIHDYIRSDAYLSNLQTNYFVDLGNGFYGQVYGGYLETMYAGVGSELLYRPLDAYQALGVGVNYVKQRDWDNMMRFTDYSTPTGFVTAYWDPPMLNGILIKLSVGQCLAKDKGTTIDVTRCFDSSVAVGIWAAISNVSKDDYGEGGFNKGFYTSTPFDLMTIGSNCNRAVVSWTPLTCDGGQMLSCKYQLYPITAEREVPAGQ